MVPLELLWKWIYTNFDAPAEKKKGAEDTDAPLVTSLPKKVKIIDLDAAVDEFFQWDELSTEVKESKTAKIAAKVLIPFASQLVHPTGQFYYETPQDNGTSSESQGTQSQETAANPSAAKKPKFYLTRITQKKKKDRVKDAPPFPEEFRQKLLNHLRTEIMGRKSNSGGSLATMNPNNGSPSKQLLASQSSFLSNSNATISPSTSMPDLSKQPTLNLHLFSDSPALTPQSSMSSTGGSNLAMTTTITPPQVTGTKRALPAEDHDRPKKKARTEKKKDEGAKANKSKKKKGEESDYSDEEEEHSQTPPLSRVNSLGEDFDVAARLKLLEDQQKQMEQQLEALKGELVLKDFVIKEVKTISSTMADPQTKSEKEVRPKRKAGRPKKKQVSDDD